MDAFTTKYKQLNARQKEAVDTIDGPVMVIAGPGTGKTTILTLRIANILKQTDTPAHGILAITYTDAGVKAMRDKLRGVIGGRAHEVNIHTFHSFAAAMIAEYPDHFLHLDGLRQISDVEQETLIREIISAPAFAPIRPMGKPDAYISSIIRSIDDAKREAQTPEMVRAFARDEIERIKNDEASISTRGATKGQLKAEALERIEKCQRTLLLADVYEGYENGKRENKMMDFNDLIIELLVALRNDQLLLRLIQERFLYLLVDEHQDTNDAQNFIVALIAEFFETPNIFIVGDEKQAIYRFQGASVENFLLLTKRWPAMKVISLDTNYRSHQSILDASFSMIENNYEDDEHKNLRIELKSGSPDEARPIEVVTGENSQAVEAHLVRELQGIAEREPTATVAIITKNNRELERLLRLLEAQGIAVSSKRSLNIFKHPVGSVFFDLIEYLADPTRTDALGKTLVAGLWGLSLDQAANITRSLRSGQSLDIEAHLPALRRIRSKSADDGAVGFVIHACQASGFVDLVARDPSYVHVWRGIVALLESLVRDGEIVSPTEAMKSLLAYRLSAESKTVKVSVGAPDLPMQAMTAHGSKGLEFDYVFIPYATEEAWVGRARGSSFVLPQKRSGEGDIRDIRRLFYVALTRAKKHVTVMTALEESDGKGLTPLRFISELATESVAEVTLPRAETVLPQSFDEASAEEARQTAITAIAKQVLMTSGLSVTALNHFLECPSKFLYESVLKLPQAPSVSAEKGSAMHAAMDRVWKLENKTVESVATAIGEAVSEYLADSFLPIAEKEAVQKELLDNAPIVATALQSHFVSPGSVFTERWVEAVFEGSYGGDSVRIPIHGKLDAIVEGPDEVAVYDYKTKQSMSVAEIKGETKNSDGGYFRQLVFYTLLVRSEPRWKNRRISTSLVFVSPDKKGRCPITTLDVTPDDIKSLQEKIQSVIDGVWSGELARGRCADTECPWCGLKEL